MSIDRHSNGTPVSVDALTAIDWRRYDFLDLGVSKGGSVRACEHYFSAGQGLGVDIDGKKVRASLEAGLHAVHADALTLEAVDVVRFVSAIDFLEHLPDLDAVEEMLANAARMAKDFIYISHPSFEGEHYLTSLGVTQYWHAWSGHRAHIEISDYCRMLQRLELQNVSIQYIDPVTTTDHGSIIPVGHRNTGPYDRAKHGPKVSVRLKQTLWRSQRIFIALRQFPLAEWREIVTSWPIREP